MIENPFTTIWEVELPTFFRTDQEKSPPIILPASLLRRPEPRDRVHVVRPVLGHRPHREELDAREDGGQHGQGVGGQHADLPDGARAELADLLKDYIANNLSEKLTVSKLSKIAGMGQTSFFNKFKSATGYSPNEYILHERINHAKVLIRMNKFSLKEIAYQCGFNSYEYFSSSFKKIEKKKPSDFRRINYTSGDPLPISRVHS